MNAVADMRTFSGTSHFSHNDFLPLYPIIERHALVVFRQMPAVEREEAVAEAVAAGFSSFVRLKERGKDPSGFPSALATFAAMHVKNGPHVGSKLNSSDVISEAAQRSRGFALQRLPQEESKWDDFLAQDSLTPIPEQVAFKIDWNEFLKSQSPRHRRIIRLLSLGHAAKWVAKKHNLSPGRVTQLRGEWRRQWLDFIGDSDA